MDKIKKIAFLSDIHATSKQPLARTDDFEATCLNKLRYVLKWCDDNDALLVQAGDFFDRPRDWGMLAEVAFAINLFRIPIYAVFGQHDTYLGQDRAATNLGLVSILPFIETPLQKSFIDVGDYRIYGVSWKEEIPTPTDDKINILVIHAPVARKKSDFPELKVTGALHFLKYHKHFKYILVGDIHQQFCIRDGDRWIFNTAPLLRKTAKKYNFEYKPCFYYLDLCKNDRIYKHVVPSQPATEVLSREHITDQSKVLQEFLSEMNEDMTSEIDLPKTIQQVIDEHNVKPSVVKIIAEVMDEIKR